MYTKLVAMIFFNAIRTLFLVIASSSLVLVSLTANAQDYNQCPWEVIPTKLTHNSAYIDIVFFGDEKKKLFYGFANYLEDSPGSDEKLNTFTLSNAENLQCVANDCEGEYKLNVKKIQKWKIYLITANHKISNYETRKARIKPYIQQIQINDKRGSIAHGPLPQQLQNKDSSESNFEICSVIREFHIDP